MNSAISKAKQWLLDGDFDPGCNEEEDGGHICPGCRYIVASTAIQNNAYKFLQASTTMAGALGRFSGRKCQGQVGRIDYVDCECPTCDARKALGAFETLFSEETVN